MGFKGMDVFEKEFSEAIANRMREGIKQAIKDTANEIISDCKQHCRVDTGAMRNSFQVDEFLDYYATGEEEEIGISLGSVKGYTYFGKKPEDYVCIWEYGFERTYGTSSVQYIEGDYMFTNAVTRGIKTLNKYLRQNLDGAIRR